MSIAHYGAVKIVVAASLSVAAAIAIMDPTTKGYVVAGCIAGVPSTIAGIFGLISLTISRRIEHKVDGMNTALTVKADNAVSQLTDTSKELAHAAGRREGIESVEEKPK